MKVAKGDSRGRGWAGGGAKTGLLLLGWRPKTPSLHRKHLYFCQKTWSKPKLHHMEGKLASGKNDPKTADSGIVQISPTRKVVKTLRLEAISTKENGLEISFHGGDHMRVFFRGYKIEHSHELFTL